MQDYLRLNSRYGKTSPMAQFIGMKVVMPTIQGVITGHVENTFRVTAFTRPNRGTVSAIGNHLSGYPVEHKYYPEAEVIATVLENMPRLTNSIID